MTPANKILPPKGSETWTMVSPELPKSIKRIVQFAKDPITNTIYISNLGSSPLVLNIEHSEHLGSPVSGKSSSNLRESTPHPNTSSRSDVKLHPVEEFGCFVTSADFARKIWDNLTAAGYKPV